MALAVAVLVMSGVISASLEPSSAVAEVDSPEIVSLADTVQRSDSAPELAKNVIAASKIDATPLLSIEQFLTMVQSSGEVMNPRKGLPIRLASKYDLPAALGEPTNIISSFRDRKGTHEILDYACSDGRVLLSVTYDMAGAWIKEIAPRRVR